VVVYGAHGVGLEVCKNLALAGVKSLNIVDDANVDASDLGSHFYSASDQVGNRGVQSVAGIRGLNARCHVMSASAGGDASLEAIECGAYDCVVCCQGATAAVAINEACRRAALRVPFVWVRCIGARFLVFDDFGDDFPVADREIHGAAAEPSLLEPLIQETTSSYFVRTAGDRERHDAVNGDRLELDTASDEGGLVLVVNEVLTPYTLRATVASGGVDPCLRYSARVVPALHIVRQRKLTDAIRDESAIASVDGAGAMRSLMARLVAAEGPALGCVAAVAGGVAAHDCLKALTGGNLGGPIPGQFLYHDALTFITPSELASYGGGRYAAASNCLGDMEFEGLRKSTIFVVGAGATGCEILKNIVLLGVSTVFVADDDAIELSNLSRQVLYRDTDVGRNQATTAKRAIDGLLSNTKVVAVPQRVDAESCLTTFDDSFWRGVDLVFTALDSFEARLYLNSICVTQEIPLVD
jgi:ubiquitin-activating enzyme E1